MLVTGTPGTGKTLHIRAFVEKLNPNFFKAVYTPLATVNILDFYRQLSVLLGGEAFYRKSELFNSIQNNIRNYVADNKKIPVIIFVEAHLLKIKTSTSCRSLPTSTWIQQTRPSLSSSVKPI